MWLLRSVGSCVSFRVPLVMLDALVVSVKADGASLPPVEMSSSLPSSPMSVRVFPMVRDLLEIVPPDIERPTGCDVRVTPFSVCPVRAVGSAELETLAISEAITCDVERAPVLSVWTTPGRFSPLIRTMPFVSILIRSIPVAIFHHAQTRRFMEIATKV